MHVGHGHRRVAGHGRGPPAATTDLSLPAATGVTEADYPWGGAPGEESPPPLPPPPPTSTATPPWAGTKLPEENLAGDAASDHEAELAARLRSLAASPGDAESLRRGLLWMAGEVQACGRAVRQATEQMEAMSHRVAAVEAREQALTRASGGLDSFRREFVWLSGEVQARSDALTRATSQIEEMIGELSSFRLQAAERIARLEAGGVSGGFSGDVRADLDRYAVEYAGATDFAEVARAALRSSLLEDTILGLRDELERVAHELFASQQDALAHVTGRTGPLEATVLELRRDLDVVAGQVRSAAAEGGGRGEAADAMGALDARLTAVETLQGELDGVYRELDRVSGHISGGEGVVADLTARLLPMEEALAVTRQELLEARAEQGWVGERIQEVGVRVDAVDDRMGAVFEGIDGVGRRIDVVGERIDMVEERIDMVGERVNGVDDRLAALAVLTSDIEGMYRELDRVAELSLSRDGALAQIADRTTPLEISVAGLRQELARLSGEVLAAQQETLGQVSERVEGVAERVGPLELLVDRVAELGHELRRVSEEAGSAQQAALAASTEQLGLAGRLRVLEVLPSDIEGMYRDFERVAEAAAARDDRQGDVLERQAAVDAAIEGLRAQVERVAGESQEAELDLRRRLAGLETLTTDLDALYRELGRVTALATDHDDRSAGFEASVAGVRDSLADLRERIEDERIYTTEQVTGLWARMRAVEGVPADVERVSTEMEKLAEAVRTAFGDSNESVEVVARRVQALEDLPSDLEGLRHEIESLAEAARAREEQVAALRGGLEPLDSALADVRTEIERVRAEVAVAGDAHQSVVDERIGNLESLPAKVEAALRVLTRTSEEVTTNHQASLAGATVLLQDFNDRLRALEALPADMEGLYAALYRVAESVKTLREEAHT